MTSVVSVTWGSTSHSRGVQRAIHNKNRVESDRSMIRLPEASKNAHPKKIKPIYQFWCSDCFFLFFFCFFFWVFLVFFGFFVFYRFFWDGILTPKSNAKRNQKIPKKNKKPINQFPISNVGQSLSQKKPKKNQKNPKEKTKKNSFQFRILAKTNAKKTKKKNKKKPMPIWKF